MMAVHVFLMVFGFICISSIPSVNAGTATVLHTCDYDIVCTFNNGRVASDPDYQTISANTPFVVAMDGPGQVIKCGRGDPHNIVQLEWTYNLNGNTVWDMSFVDAADRGNGQPFKDDGWMVSIDGVGIDGNAPPITWPKCWNSYCGCVQNCVDPQQVYIDPDSDKGNPNQNPVRTCPTEVNLVWNICHICPNQVPKSYEDHVQTLDQNPTRRATRPRHRPGLGLAMSGTMA